MLARQLCSFKKDKVCKDSLKPCGWICPADLVWLGGTFSREWRELRLAPGAWNENKADGMHSIDINGFSQDGDHVPVPLKDPSSGGHLKRIKRGSRPTRLIVESEHMLQHMKAVAHNTAREICTPS